jgi:L-aspartate oxidase
MLECLVFGRRAALAALDMSARTPVPGTYQVRTGFSGTSEKDMPVTPDLREAMWEDAGLIRTADGLGRLAGSPHLLASLVARSALAREESRGGHFRADFREEDGTLDGLHTVIRPGREPELVPWS